MSVEEYSDLYDTLKKFIDDKSNRAKSRDFPSSVEELKKEIEMLEKVKSKEIPAKKKDMAVLSDMNSKLEAQKKKRSSAPGVPEGKEFPRLQEVCVSRIGKLCNSHSILIIGMGQHGEGSR